MNMYRQGDILIIEIQSIPAGATPLNHKTLAFGEVTGHSHVVDGEATLYQRNSQLFLQAHQSVMIRHEEHADFEIPAGLYRVVRQRELDEGQIRYVRD